MLSNEVKYTLMAAIRDARIKVIGYDLVKNDAEALMAAAVIRAYGNSAAGFVYLAPTRAQSQMYPPDIVLCHPDVGLLVIEVKGFVIGQIQGLEAGSLIVRSSGLNRPVNAYRQAEDQMFEIENDLRKLIRNRREMPLLNAMVAFPNIWESEWRERGFDKAHPDYVMLFRDHLEARKRLKRRIAYLVRESMKQARKEKPLNEDQLRYIQMVFGNSDVINDHRPPRREVEQESLGGYIDEMMALEKYLSEEQKELSRLAVGEYPRLIRGVAGSGKSVVLARMVARYLHRRMESLEDAQWSQGPPSVAVICFNQALVSFLRQKIRTAFREQTLNEDIPSDILRVTYLNDLMFQLSRDYRGWFNYIRVQDVQGPIERAKQYREQLAELREHHPEIYNSLCFDVVFVDEGQDFEEEEFRLMLDLIRTHPETGEKPIVIFYDDAQNLYGRARPVWKDIGINVAVGDRSRVMQECFRNTRQIVELAFNVLLGTQAPEAIRVQTRTYADVAYLKERGLIEEAGDHFRVGFAEREGNRPEVHAYPTEDAEIQQLADKIIWLVREQQVRLEDILVLFPNTYFPYENLQKCLQAELPDMKFVLPFGDHRGDKQRFILQPRHLTLSTVHGAKGYDAPIVFLCGADRFDVERQGRAGFYVGATRAKMLLFVTGVRREEPTLLDEALSVVKIL
ncbi:MAG: hypothetical protein D6791_07055 [Chloroflexi bacterium]|nr:MAG: hypothetical protein D6791_07055 [Chloroflexota bacterium]